MRWGMIDIVGAVRRFLPLVGVIPLLWVIATEPAVADKRVALVVGNSAYRSVTRLDNPTNDATLMAVTLRALGFTLVGGGAQLDLDKPAFDNAVQMFSVQIQGADVGLFYYAGHGVQVRSANYLVPVSANPTRKSDVDFQLVDTALVLRQMESAGTKLNIVILDACRNNPFGDRGFRATTRGLAQMQAPEGTLISYATQPGNIAQDGADGNSPYTKALAATIRQPGLGIFDAFNEVGLVVKRSTGGAQQPWVSSSPIAGTFYFAGAPAAPAASAGQPVDEVTWGVVSGTKDPEQLRRFIEQFPASARRGEAMARLFALERAREEQKVTVVEPPGSPSTPNAQNQQAAAAPLYDPVNAVLAFYEALSRADGTAAAALVIPEKRGIGPFNEKNISQFYSSLRDPLRVSSIDRVNDNVVHVRYRFTRPNGTSCIGDATVQTILMDGRAMIQKISSNC